MQRVKRVWCYQKIMRLRMLPVRPYSPSVDPYPSGRWSGVGGWFLFCLLAMAAFRNCLLLSGCLATLVYMAATRPARTYVMLPVSRRFAVGNLFLLPYVFAPIIIGVGVVWLLLSQLLYPGWSLENPEFETTVALPNHPKTLLLVLLTAVLLLSVVTALSTVRYRTARRCGVVFLVAGGAAAVSVLQERYDDFSPVLSRWGGAVVRELLPGFAAVSWWWLVALAAATVLAVPLCWRLALHNYMADTVQRFYI